MSSDRVELTADRVDVARLVRNCAHLADTAAHAAEITLIADLPDELPQLLADERRLQQAVNHLLSNAIKFTGPRGTVTVGATLESDGRLLLFVRDTGIGIAPDDIDRVFEPFSQLDGAFSRRFQGAGLGLYASRALVHGHGGVLSLQSAPGQGTLAEIRLPAERVLPPVSSQASEHAPL